MSAPHVTTEAAFHLRLSRAIESGRAPHLRPILVAVRDFGCGWATVPQRAGRFDIPEGRPNIVVIGDDATEALGIAGFHRKSLRRFLRTCGAVVVVSCDPQTVFYAAAATTAVERRQNTVVIETRLSHEAEWVALAQAEAPEASFLVGTVRPETGARH